MIPLYFLFFDDTTLVAESEEELKSFLMKVKEKSGKAGLKLNIQKMKIMWKKSKRTQTDGEIYRVHGLGESILSKLITITINIVKIDYYYYQYYKIDTTQSNL